MPVLEFWLALAAVLGAAAGLCGIIWERAGQKSAALGRRLGVGALVFLGLVSLVAAVHRADGLVPLGLVAGFLVVGLLWGEPQSAWQEHPAD